MGNFGLHLQVAWTLAILKGRITTGVRNSVRDDTVIDWRPHLHSSSAVKFRNTIADDRWYGKTFGDRTSLLLKYSQNTVGEFPHSFRRQRWGTGFCGSILNVGAEYEWVKFVSNFANPNNGFLIVRCSSKKVTAEGWVEMARGKMKTPTTGLVHVSAVKLPG